MAIPPLVQLLAYKLPKPFGKLPPYPCEDEEKHSQKHQSTLYHRRPQESFQYLEAEEDGEEEKQCADDHPHEPFEEFPAERYVGLRRGKLAAAATGANLGASRIRVMPGAEFLVKTPPAGIAKERVSRSDSSTVIAMFHWGSLMSGSLASPVGRSHTGAKRPSR